MRAFAKLNSARDRMIVQFPFHEDAVAGTRKIDGARYVPREKGGPHWTLPLDMTCARALRKLFGDGLTLTPEVLAWGREERDRERNLGAIARADDWDVDKLKLARLRPDMAAYLRPYQRADIAMMGETNTINANQMGLGKTIEVIFSVVESGLETGPHLVIALKTALDTVWAEEIRKWLPEHEVVTWSGDLKPDERKDAIDRLAAAAAQGRPYWLLTNAHALRDGLPVSPVQWNSFTIDEFHKAGLSNSSGDPTKGSQFSQAARKTKAARKFALSGTPMGGQPIKLWGVLNWLKPEFYTSKWRWAAQWLEVEEDDRGHKVVGGLKPGKEEEFYRVHAKHMVRRLRSEVMPQLPSAIRKVVLCDMLPAQKKAYDKFEADAEIRIDGERLSANEKLAEYARLKQLANALCRLERDGKGVLQVIPTTQSGKLERLWERLEEQGIRPGADKEHGELALVGSESARMVGMVAQWLRDKGLKVEVITGMTKQADRTRIQDETRDPATRAQIIAMTTTAGGMSINLQEANAVHALDETWNPDDQEQLFGRADRGSRTGPLLTFTYRSRNTIQEDIGRVTDGKSLTNRELLDALRNRHKKG